MTRTVTPPTAQNAPTDGSRTSLRSVCDSLVTLGIAIVLVRGFLVEGYLITTGSMAPHLYGAHKKVVCPSCGTLFSVGTEFDDRTEDGTGSRAICPNCLRDDIDLSNRPVERGDHLLVWKNAYDWREPRRWEVVVFRNPDTPLETFIKRIAGLPGETVQIRGGNLFVDGQIARKPLQLQRTFLVPVYDSSHAPSKEDKGWSLRWLARDNDPRWRRSEGRFLFTPGDGRKGEIAWLDYRHTVRHGGIHRSRVVISEPLTSAQRNELHPPVQPVSFTSTPRFPGVTFDPDTNALVCRGVMTQAVKHALFSVDQTPALTQAILELDRLSHVGRIDDFLAYDNLSAGVRSIPVDEILWRAEVEAFGGTLIIAIHPAGRELECWFDFDAGRVTLSDPVSGEVFREALLPPRKKSSRELEVSTIDRQICIAVDRTDVIDPWLLDEFSTDFTPSEVPISVGAAGRPITIAVQRLFRDVYYTGGRERHAVRNPLTLGKDEFFMLGDNSSVSADSRSWQDPAVPRKLLIGKPFLVHLPSRTVVWGKGGALTRIRIPDWSRIRFVR